MKNYLKIILAGLLIGSQALAGLPPTTSKVIGDSTNVTSFNFAFPNFTGTHTGTNFSLGVNSILGGGTGQTTANAGFNALSPLTTKGDLNSFTTVNTRHAVPADYGNIIADSQQTDGWRSTGYTQTQGKPGKNYIQYADFENNSTTGWTLGTIGTLTNGLPTGSPTFGSGASGNLSLAVLSSGQISGAYSMTYVSSAATTAGNMVASSSYAIDSSDQAKALSFSISYRVTSGASNVNFSATSSSSYLAAVYDVTNSVFLPITSPFVFTQGTGVGIASGSFQTGPTTANIRFIIYNANATAGAATLALDDVLVGPNILISGSSGAVDFIGTTGSGQSITINATNITFAATKDSNAGWTGSTYVVPITGDYMVAGQISTSASAHTPGVYLNGTLVPQGNWNSATVAGAVAAGSILVPNCKAGDIISLRSNATSTVSGGSLSINLVNGGSFVSLGSTSVIATTVYGTPASYVANAPIIFPTVIQDSTGSYNATTGRYLVPVSGFYQVNSFVASNNQPFTTYLSRNGSGSTGPNAQSLGFSGNGTTTFVNGSALIYALAGDFLDVRQSTAQGTGGVGNVSFNLVGGGGGSSAASVNARYFSSSTSVSGSLATIVYTTKTSDTNNAYSSGLYTIPVSGKYQVNAAIAMTGTFALNSILDLQIQQTGSSSQISESKAYSGGAITQMNTNVGDIFTCVAGDVIKVQASNSGTLPVIAGTTSQNWFSISRVGN